MVNHARPGRALTRSSAALLRAHGHLVAYPLTNAVVCLVLVLAFGWAASVAFASSMGVLGLVALVVLALCLIVVDTISSAALVWATDRALSATPGVGSSGWGPALRHLGALLPWSFIRAGVGAALSVVRGDGSQGGGVLLRGILASAGGIAWNAITHFVVPVIVLEGLSARGAISRSAELTRQRWGTQISGSVRIGARVGLVLVVPGILLAFAGLAMLADPGGVVAALGWPALVVGLLALAFGLVIISTLKGVFSVVLYRFASLGQPSDGFSVAELHSAFPTTSGGR